MNGRFFVLNGRFRFGKTCKVAKRLKITNREGRIGAFLINLKLFFCSFLAENMRFLGYDREKG